MSWHDTNPTREHELPPLSQSKKKKLGKGWSSPQKDWVKLNFDASIRENETSIAVIAISENGEMLLAWVDQLVSESPLLGEAKAALRAIKRAVLEGYINIIIESDAWNVIEPLSKYDAAPIRALELL